MKRTRAAAVLCLVLCCLGMAACPAGVPKTYPLRLGTFSDQREHGVTDLFIYSPWSPGQYAQLTLPEHCWGVTLPNTSHDSKAPVSSPWRISGDSTAAVFEKNPRDGVTFRATAACDSMAVKLRIEIENQSADAVKDIRALVCLKPDNTIGNPGRGDCMRAFRDTSYALTYFPSGGRKIKLHQDTHYSGEYPPGITPENIRTKIVWGINVKGCPDIRSIEDVGWWYIGDHPGRVVEEQADPALIAIQARGDSTRWLATIWDPPRVLFANPLNPCFHSDPSFADCPPGGKTSAEGIVFFHDGTFAQLVERALAWKAALHSAKESGK